jgi:hypothetical protein
MMEFFYGLLVRLHPPAFRERFAAEMTLNFEEAGRERAGRLLLDGFVSLLRQWLLRSGSWKLAVAVGIASLQLIGISPAWHLQRSLSHFGHGSPSVRDQQDLGFIIVCATAFVVVLATMTSLWVRGLVNARLKATARRKHAAI